MSADQRRLAAIGNYQLSSITIDKGSFSKVVLANHILLKKNVAMKILTLSNIEDPYVLKNINREATIMSKLHHSNVVGLHEVCSTKDFFCLVMDFYPGGNLCDLVQDHPNGKLEEKQARIYFKQMVDGLSYIHSQHIIHRDMKLENIFLNKEKTMVVIGDFGLSNFWKPGSNLKTRCGSAEYAAPEILDKKKNYDQAVDIWSLGIILYAMLSGQLPFEVIGGYNNIKELSDIIMSGLTRENFEKLGEVSVEVKLLISQLLVVDMNNRIKIEDVVKHIWITQIDYQPTISTTLTQDMQVKVAKMVQEKLKLNHLTPFQILAYVFSAKGMFGKTAGCFNLMAKDLSRSSMKPMEMVKIKDPVLVAESSHSNDPSVITNPILITADRLPARNDDQPSSFWYSSTGRKAVADLQNVKLDSQDKENDSHGKIEKVTVAVLERKRMKSHKPSSNAWRRSIKCVPGQKRTGRLKRVEREMEGSDPKEKEIIRKVRTPLVAVDGNTLDRKD